MNQIIQNNSKVGDVPDVNDIPDEELLRRVMRNLHARRGVRKPKRQLWAVVMDRFGLGSTFAQQLCRRFGRDPEEMVNE